LRYISGFEGSAFGTKSEDGRKTIDKSQRKLSNGDYKGTLKYAQEAIRIFNKIPEAKYLVAICKADMAAAYGSLGDYENAIKEAKECISLVNGKSELVFTEGSANKSAAISLKHLGRLKESIGHYELAKYLYQQTPKGTRYLPEIEHNLKLLQKQVNEPPEIGESKGTKSTKDCFIATAVYGDINAKEVIVLRRYRDEKMSSTFLGKIFIQFYYSGTGKTIGILISTQLDCMIPLLKSILDNLVSRFEKNR